MDTGAETENDLATAAPSRPPTARPERTGCCCSGRWIVVLLAVTAASIAMRAAVLALWERSLAPRHDRGWIGEGRRKLPPVRQDPTPAEDAYDVYSSIDLKGILATPKWLSIYWGGDVETVRLHNSEARRLIEQQQQALDELHAAAGMQCGRSQPRLFPWHGVGLSVAGLAAARAAVLHFDGDDPTALRQIEDILAMGVALTAGDQVTATLNVEAALRVSLTVLSEGQLASEELSRHAEHVRELRSWVPPLSAALLPAAHAELSWISGLARDRSSAMRCMGWPIEFPEGYAYMERVRLRLQAQAAWRCLPQTREWAEDRLARLIEAADEPFGGSSFSALVVQTEADIAERGEGYFGSRWSRITGQQDARWETVGMLMAEECIACLEAYYREHGHYPRTLEALTPAYMPAMPKDPWTGGAMAYRKGDDGYTLYSVGPNRRDDGGVGEPPSHSLGRPDYVYVPLERHQPWDPWT